MTTSTVTAERASFWARVIAFVVDVVLLSIVSQIVASVLTPASDDPFRGSGISTLLGLAYYLYFWSSYGGGQTLGMRALSIKVVKTDGAQLDIVGALIRYVGLIISFAALFIGVIWVAFDAQRQGWHDKLANTYVVKA